MLVRRYAAVRWAVLLVLPLAVGCGDSPSTPDEAGNGEKTKPRVVASARCTETLESVLDMLRPQRFEVSVGADSPLSLLNRWSADCESDELRELREEIVGERLRELLPETWRERALSDVFVTRDAAHVRNALLLREAAEAVARRSTDDVARVVDVFEFVVRQIRLTEPDDPLAGLSPFHALVFGTGSARDRAWTFAALLRQLHIDAVIVRPAANDGEASVDPRPVPLVGVLLDGRCYLFDPKLGTPIPSESGDPEAPLVQRPATLAEVRAEGELLAALDRPDEPYRFDDEDFAEVEVELIGNTTGWAPRMAGLQSLLTGDRSAVVLDPLDDTRLGPGLATRVLDAGEGLWESDGLGVWSYPEESLETTLESMPEDRRRAVLARRDVLHAPVSLSREGNLVPQHLLLQARLDQLAGRLEEATNVYVGVRNADRVVPGLPPHVIDLHRDAAEDARLWAALAASDQGDRTSAAGALSAYQHRFPRGRWRTTVIRERAVALARAGEIERAVAELEKVPEGDPAHDGLQVLADRWRTLADGTADPAPAESAADE